MVRFRTSAWEKNVLRAACQAPALNSDRKLARLKSHRSPISSTPYLAHKGREEKETGGKEREGSARKGEER